MRRSIKYGLYGAVLAGLIAAPVAWISVDNTVHLVVDGKGDTVTTTASNVGDVLDDQGYKLTSHDIVAPSAHSAIHDGMQVVLRRGRLLHLSIDGVSKDVWTTAPTVRSALGQLGYSTSDFVSVSRSRRLPLKPTDMTIRTPRAVTVIHDGKTEQVTTTDATVASLLNDIGVTMGPKDKLSTAVSSPIVAGQTIRLQRVGEKTITRTQTVAYPVKRKADPALDEGKTEVATKGKDGKLKVTYSVVYVDGKEVARTKLSSVTLRAPKAKIISVGTKQVPRRDTARNIPTVGPPSPGSNKAIARELLAKRGWSDQYSCLVQMWNNESGWQTDAANPSGAYGIPQALPGSKMASAGSDWQTNPTTQIKWGLRYIASRYNTPCEAWSFWQAHNYY